MPNKKSAMKELRKTERRTARNQQVKRRLRELIKKVDKFVSASQKEEAVKLYDKIQKIVDKAAKRSNPFNDGKADRIKSRVAKKINKIAKSDTDKK